MSTTLVFLHGGPGFSDYLRPYFEELEPRFKCVFFDQKKGSAIRVDDLLHQLEKFVVAETNKVVLVGHSWGGILALEYASRHPEQLAGLVLMSTGAKASDLDEYEKELKNSNLENPTREQLFLSAEENEVGKPFLDETWTSFSEETFVSLSSTYLNQFDLTSKLAELNLPILNFYGERDLRFPLSVAKSFRKINDRVEDFCLEGAGHFPFLLKQNRLKIYEKITQRFT